MRFDLDNKVATTESPLKLDQSRLLGFRNLVVVANADLDISESSELAFNKKGATEPPPAKKQSS